MRMLGIDLGLRRTGVATCDEREILASPFAVLTIRGLNDTVKQLLPIIEREKPGRIVVGLPLHTDGTYGEKAFTTDVLRRLLESGEKYDEIVAVGPPVMMKFVSLLTKQYGVKTIVSMNPIMIDGTGMCGGCRVTVGGKIKFACVDGPEFDGHEVDFDELIRRNSAYAAQEREAAHRYNCNLMKMAEKK